MKYRSAEAEAELSQLRQRAKPIADLTDSEATRVVMAMIYSDGAIIEDLYVLPGRVALVQDEKSGRRMATFNNEDEMRAFAKKYGFEMCVGNTINARRFRSNNATRTRPCRAARMLLR